MSIRRGWLLLVLLACCSIVLGQAAAPPQDIDIRRDITFTTVDNTPLKLDIYLPQQITHDIPVILGIHGGSWVKGDRRELHAYDEAMARQGYAVVAPDYRLLPNAIYPCQLNDMREAVRWVTAHAAEYHFDMSHFFVLGVSAGGHLAAMLGTQPAADCPKIAAVIAISAPLDFTAPIPSLTAKIAVQLYLGASREDNPELYKDASPVTHVSATSPPFLLIHGIDDPLVPSSQSERMADALRAAKVPVVILPVKDLKHVLPAPDAPLGREIMQSMLQFLANPTAPPLPAAPLPPAATPVPAATPAPALP